MRSCVIGLDVADDLLPRLIDRFPLRAPGASLLELTEPALDECLGLGVSVTAAAVRDPSRPLRARAAENVAHHTKRAARSAHFCGVNDAAPILCIAPAIRPDGFRSGLAICAIPATIAASSSTVLTKPLSRGPKALTETINSFASIT